MDVNWGLEKGVEGSKMQIFVREPWSGKSLLYPVDERLTVGSFKRKVMAALTTAVAAATTETTAVFWNSTGCPNDDDDDAVVSLVYGGKRLQEQLLLLRDCLVENLSTVDLRLPLRGGGGDGGATGAESRDCYLKMYAEKKPDKVDPKDARIAKWSRCCLTSEALQPPCAIDFLGNLFNKENAVRALMDKSLPKALGHIHSLKDIITLRLTENSGLPASGGGGGRHDTHDKSAEFESNVAENRFCCPISGLEFNGMFKFVALADCGHALSARALKELKSTSCPVCSKPFEESDQIIINGSEEEVRVLKDRLRERKEKMKMSKKKEMKKKRREGREERGEDLPLGGDKDGRDLQQRREMKQSTGRDEDDLVVMSLKKNHSGTAVTSSNGAGGGGGVAMSKVGSKGEGERGRGGGVESAPAKRFKAVEHLPQNATKEVYASIFTSSGRSDAVPETYSCRSLPIGRN